MIRLSSTSLKESDFDDIDMSNTRFHDIDLDNSVFEDASLRGCVFDDVDLQNVEIRNAKLNGMTIDGISVIELLDVYDQARSNKSGNDRSDADEFELN